MNKQQRIENKIAANKEIAKRIEKSEYYSTERFISDAKRYIKAIKEGRMLCNIGKVSQSGMSRTMHFVAPEKNKHTKKYQYCQLIAFLEVMGYKCDRDGYLRAHGCGMDMVFHTNYTIIHRLRRLGFITKKQCEGLSQQTPHVM